MRSLSVLTTISIFAVTSACSPDRGNPKPPLPQVQADASEAVEDTGSSQMPDMGMMSMMDTGMMMGMVDTGLPLSMACMELEGCCNELPGQIQGPCLERVAANIDSDCISNLQMAQEYGFCLPPDHDAGMRGDVGPLGPSCSAYLACCPELGPLQTRCEDTAMDGDEAACDMALQLARRVGYCQMPPDSGVMMDAGTSTTSMDAGTSTTGMDAGTSTTGMDAGTGTSTAPFRPDGG